MQGIAGQADACRRGRQVCFGSLQNSHQRLHKIRRAEDIHPGACALSPAICPQTKIGLFSGASLSEDVENPIASFVGKRGPYMSSSASRKLINAGEMDFADIHLSTFARNFIYGFYGDIDLAVVEVSRIRPDGSVILSSSVGVSAEALTKAKKIILEVNPAIPDYTGFHDIALPTVHPRVGWPIPIVNVADRVGTPMSKSTRAKSSPSSNRTSRITRSASNRHRKQIAGSRKMSSISSCTAIRLSIGESACRPFSRGRERSQRHRRRTLQVAIPENQVLDRSIPGRHDALRGRRRQIRKRIGDSTVLFRGRPKRVHAPVQDDAAKRSFSGRCGFPTMPK